MSDAKVVITGTSQGIGRHLACKFLNEGYGVIGINRSTSDIQDVNYSELIADLSDRRQIANVKEDLEQHNIVGLINNAGIHGPIGRFEDLSFDQWLDTFQVNLFSAASLTHACIPAIRKEQGFIIFVSGGGSAFPRINYSAYGVSKCAVIRLSEALSVELSPDVLVYCIAPGPNRTRLLEEAVRSGDIVPDEEMVDFDYPERLCLFLAKNKDPRYSGKFIHVNDDYSSWGIVQLDSDGYTLRRMDTRTLSKLNLNWP